MFYRLFRIVLFASSGAMAVFAQSDAERHHSTGMNETAYAAAARSAGGLRVLFIGNSITLHGPLASIGWTNNWGMAASAGASEGLTPVNMSQ